MSQTNDSKKNDSKHQILIIFSIGLAIALLLYGLLGSKEDKNNVAEVKPSTTKLTPPKRDSTPKPVSQVVETTTTVDGIQQESESKQQTVVETKISFDEFKKDLDVLSGSVEAIGNRGSEKYDIQAIFREVKPGGLETPGIFVVLIIANAMSEGERDIYKGEVEPKSQNVFYIKNMQRMVDDEVKDKYGKYSTRYQSKIRGVPEVFEATINSSEAIELKYGDSHKGNWNGSLIKLNTKFISKFEGRWNGFVGDRKAYLEIKKVNGKYLANIKLLKKYPCEVRDSWVRPIGTNRISIIGGEVKGWANDCGSGEPLFRIQINDDGSLQLMAYSTNINRSPIAGRFKR